MASKNRLLAEHSLREDFQDLYSFYDLNYFGVANSSFKMHMNLIKSKMFDQFYEGFNLLA
jgi:hypothetical protein